MDSRSPPTSQVGGQSVPQQKRPVTEETRRQVTVLFCDLVGSTALAGQLDPEELRELLLAYQNAAAEALEQFGGRLHFTLGDGLMASWGWPRAREDDATRAVLAGLAVVGAVAELGASRGSVDVRIAVHSGLAVIADSLIGSRREVANLIGETPNVAARLQSIARPGSVVISETTEDLVRGRFELSGFGPVALKGVRRPLGAFEVVRAADLDAPDSPPRTGLRVVGRSQEVRQLESAWRDLLPGRPTRAGDDAARASNGAGRVLFLTGAAGIGKSHLAEHMRRYAAAGAGAEVMIRCSSLQSTHAFYAIRRMLERAVSIAPGDPAGRRRDRLSAFCAGRPSLSAPDAVDVLGALVGAAAPGAAIALNPEQRRERTFALLLAVLDSLAAEHPTLIVVEDAHWADPSTAEFLRRLLQRGPAPGTLVLITTRDDEPEGERIALGPLAPEAIDDILAGAAPALSPHLRARAVQRSDGVPLFAEELGRMLLRQGTAAEAFGDVPPRLQDLLVARLDERPDERPLLQVMATIGVSALRSFVEQVADRDSDEVRQGLGILVQAGILVDEGPEHDPVYRFQHVLLRDAAYTTLLRSSRRELHRAIAAALAADAGPTWLQADALAHHTEQAGDLPASALWWYRAALQSAGVAAHREVATHLRHVLELLERTGPLHDVPEVDVLVLLGVSLIALEGYTSADVAVVHQRAEQLLRASPHRVQRPGFFYSLWAYHHVRGDLSASSALSEQLWQQARRELDAQVRQGSGQQVAVAAAMAGYDAFERGHLDRAVELLTVAQLPVEEPLADTPHDIWSAATVLLGVGRWLRGERSAGREAISAAVARADGLGMPKGAFTRAFVHTYAAWARLLDDDPQAALAHADSAMQEAQAGGYTSWFVAACMHAAGARARTGDPVGAGTLAATLEGMLEAWRAGGAELFRPVFLGWLGEARRAGHELSSARQAFAEGIEHATAFGGRVHEPELLRMHARIAREQGEHERAIAGLRRAVHLAERQGAWSLSVRAASDLVELDDADPVDVHALEVATARVSGAPDEPDLQRAARLLLARR